MANSKKTNNNKTAMRTRTKGVGSNFATVVSTKTAGVNSVSGGYRYDYFTLDPLNAYSVTGACANVAAAYEFYRVKSYEVEFIPAGGLNAVGVINAAYITNSELMTAFVAGSDVTRESIMYNEQGNETYSIALGGVKRMSGSRVTSRKWYATNFTLGATADDYDRTIAGLLIVRSEYASGIPPFRMVIRAVYEFTGLGRTGPLTLSDTAINGPEPYKVALDTQVFPTAVQIVNRQGEYQMYIIPTPPKPACIE